MRFFGMSYLRFVILTVETLGGQARWPGDRLASVPGRCRGDALGPWGHNLCRRFGPDAVDRIRRRLGPPLDQLGAVLSARDWVPAHAQVAVTEAIVDEYLDGDMLALYPLLVDDTRSSLGRAQLLLLRTLGPERSLRLVPRTFRNVYEDASAEIDVRPGRARMTLCGNPLFEHPTWRRLQLFGLRALLELVDRRGEVVGEGEVADGFTAIATW